MSNVLPLWMRALVALIIGAAVAGVLAALYHSIYQSGYDARDAIAVREKQAAEDAARQRYDKVAAEALTRERALRAVIDRMTTDRLREETEHEKTVADLQSRVRAGDERLRIAVARRPLSGCAAPGDPAAAGGTGGQETADILPESAARIIGIAAASAKDVRDYNRIVDLYNDVRQACNVQAR